MVRYGLMVRYGALLCGLIFLSSSAFACGVMEKADPKVGSSVSGSLDHLQLSFSEAVVPLSSTITISNATGEKIPNTPVTASNNDMLLSTHVPVLSLGNIKYIGKCYGEIAIALVAEIINS